MNFATYQREAHQFAAYQDEDYPLLGLTEETGEFVGIFAKVARGDDLDARFGSPEGMQTAILKEAGDVLWMLAECLGNMGLSLQDAAELNLKKLSDRRNRGVIKGSGDDR